MPLKEIKPTLSIESLNAYYRKRLTFTDFFFWEILLIVISLAFLASIYQSSGQVSSWYNSLSLAPWQPPNWVFGLIWTILYLLIALTGYTGIKSDPRRWVFSSLFIIGLFLNVIWCMTFYFESILGGLIVLIILDVVVLTQIIYLLAQRNRAAKITGGILILYLIWIAYATSLNGYLYTNN